MASMNSAASPGAQGVPYTVPPEPSRLPSVLLAVAMHAVLLAFLYIGVNWQNHEPVTVEAEVWDMRVQDAAPAPAAEPPPPPPEPEPAPRPEPQPAPPPEPVKQAEPPPSKPDIALERKKQKELEDKLLKEQQLKREREERLAEEKRQKEELKKKELEKKEQDKKLAEKKEQEKKLAEKKEKELAEKKEKELADKKAKEKADKLAKAKAAEEQKRLDKLRAAEMARITGAAGSGTAAQSTAPRVDEGYKLAIQTKIKNNTTYLGNPENNPRVEFKVEQLPTGEIISVRMTKSSGIPAFDDAVEKGIMKSSPLPKKKDGTVERTVTVGYRPRDLD